MKKKLIVLGSIVLGVVLLYSFFAGKYNTMVELGTPVEKQWANVQGAYQRRADLIPNLVSTVKGYAEFEKSTLTAVTEARAKATSTNIDASKLTPETMKQFQEAQNQLSSSLSRLLVSVEQYPDLKANQNFMDLQSQLEGTENRINTERNKYNEVVNDYNIYIKRFPNNMLAGIYGMQQKTFFEAAAGSDKAPAVKF
jgi:LemA protein